MLSDTIRDFMREVRDTARLASEIADSSPNDARAVMLGIVSICDAYLGGEDEDRAQGRNDCHSD